MLNDYTRLAGCLCKWRVREAISTFPTSSKVHPFPKPSGCVEVLGHSYFGSTAILPSR